MRIVLAAAALLALAALFGCAQREMFATPGSLRPSAAAPLAAEFPRLAPTQRLQPLRVYTEAAARPPAAEEEDSQGLLWLGLGAAFLAAAAALQGVQPGPDPAVPPRVATLALSSREAASSPTSSGNVTQRLGGVQLTPLGPTGRAAGEAVSLASLWAEKGAVVFAVRRPGWPLCREEAADLCSALKDADLAVPVVAVVKEEELAPPVEDEAKMLGVAEFRDQYFCGPLYLSDADRTLYEFLGNGNIFSLAGFGKALLNPLKTRRSIKDMNARFTERGIEGNMVGDGLKKGGVLCIAPDGELLHTFYEDPGNGIPADDRAKIVEAVRSFGAR